MWQNKTILGDMSKMGGEPLSARHNEKYKHINKSILSGFLGNDNFCIVLNYCQYLK